MPPEDDIHQLLVKIQGTGDAAAVEASRELIWQFRAEALAKPNKARVDLLRARLLTRLREVFDGGGRADSL